MGAFGEFGYSDFDAARTRAQSAPETQPQKLERLEAELRWRKKCLEQQPFGLHGKVMRADIAKLEKQITPLREDVRKQEEAAERERNRVTIPKDLTFKAAATPNETAAGQKITAPSIKGLFKPK